MAGLYGGGDGSSTLLIITQRPHASGRIGMITIAKPLMIVKSTIFTARRLDPGKTYAAHLVVSSLPYPAMAYDVTFPIAVDARHRFGHHPVGECGAVPILATGELLDAVGAVLARSGPVKLFTLSCVVFATASNDRLSAVSSAGGGIATVGVCALAHSLGRS